MLPRLNKVEIRRTPIGDGNESDIFSLFSFLVVEIRRTPIGDGNEPQINESIYAVGVEIRRTPIGDGNQLANIPDIRFYFGRNKKNPDRGRKLWLSVNQPPF